jgi:hypothetical protein
MRLEKSIVYQYADDTLSDEVEIDLTGELHFAKGEIVARWGKNWKIESIMVEEPIQKLERPTLWHELVYAPVN